jgi:replicative superfamily II helicase
MSFVANFIGINKYANQNIRELTCALRDATALWALFCDTIPEIRAELLTNERATCEIIRKVLKTTLESAEQDDIVIISFAGHGTHDHRLVAYNTIIEDLNNTAISMQELATFFKSSPAKIILCILDCCFSGEAPARVLEDSPIPRDTGVTLNTLAGKGCLLIAASSANEPAMELPCIGYGLLTYAIIKVLQAKEDTVSLPTAMDEVLKFVRTEASKIGVVQNPVLYGYVEGGLVLPSLRPGKHFFNAFPEIGKVNISKSLTDLKKFDIPAEIILEWENQFKGGLNDLQLEAINKYRILNGASLLVIAPTSTGKTFIGEMASVRAIIDGRKAIFLFPYRALVNEKYEYFSKLYREKLKMRVIRCSGDYTDQISSFLKGKYDLALFTFEMFLNVAIDNPHVLNQIGLIVLDEAQFITDPNRGITVELILTYLLFARKNGIAPQLIALSAVIGGINNFDRWLDINLLVTNKRPVPLIEGVLDRGGTLQFCDPSGKIVLSQLLYPRNIVVRGNKASSKDVIVPLLKKLICENSNEKVIVFRNMRGKSEGCAKYLSADLNLPPAKDIEIILPTHDLSASSESLRACLNGGTAFHNTNLNPQERIIVERAFRDPNSKVRVMCTTTTLAAGINTPASTVILAEQEFIGEDGRPFTVAEYKNMVGRAGRLGFHEEGRSIILANTEYERETLFNRYVKGPLESISSSFDPRNIETWLVRLLAQIDRLIKKEVVHLLLNTYGGYLANRDNPEWQTTMNKDINELLDKMIKLGLVEEEGECVRLTLLGRACGQSSLSFDSTLRTVEFLRLFPRDKLTTQVLMGLIQVLPELDDCYVSVMKKGQKEAIRVSEASIRYGSDVVKFLQRYIKDFWQYYGRCKKAAILYDWINGVSIEDIEKQYSTSPYSGRIGYGDIRRFADITRFHLRSVYQIALTMDIVPNEEKMEALLYQLEIGIPEGAIPLLSLPLRLERGEYLALYNVNIKTIKDIWAVSSDQLKIILGKTLAYEIENLRPK